MSSFHIFSLLYTDDLRELVEIGFSIILWSILELVTKEWEPVEISPT